MSWSTFRNLDASPEQIASYASALDALHAFHDALSSAAPDAATLDRLAADLQQWTKELAPQARPELERLAGRLPSLPVRGHPAIPPVLIETADAERVEGTVTFGAFFLGGGGAAHGGTIMTVFDEVLGVLAVAQTHQGARTAYLKTDFRSLVPLDTPLRVSAWIDRTEGRKHFVRGEMRDGDTLCAEADALFLEVRDLTP